MIDQAEIHRMAQSGDAVERRRAVNKLRSNFANLPDKEKAWADIQLLLFDMDWLVRKSAAYALGLAFLYVPDKNQAWIDLQLLANGRARYVRRGVAYAIGLAFPHVPDKNQAWTDLHRFVYDKDNDIRRIAVDAIGLALFYIPDKEQAWIDIQLLAKDYDRYVRRGAAYAIGLTFPHVPDKNQALAVLNQLAQDEDRYVRAYTHFSLGRISISKAIEAQIEENFRKEFEKAIEFFEKSSSEELIFYPARFCLPFYRLFYTITFKEQEVEAEVQKYLDEAKFAVEGSESKEKLLEAVENLANALKEVHNAREMGFEDIKINLNVYRQYIKHVEDLLESGEENAPIATKLIKKGLPIIDERIKEIKKKTDTLCKQTKGTQLEDLGKEVNQIGIKFSQVRDPIGLIKAVDNLQTVLTSICSKMPEDEKEDACILLRRVREEQDVEDKINLFNMILSKISTQISTTKNIEILQKKFDKILVSLKPGISEELILSVGVEFSGTGAQHVITIPIQEISYLDLKKDLEKIKERNIIKLTSLSANLTAKVSDYLIRNKKDELAEYLS